MWIFAIGFFAQLLFGDRMLIQWFQSEKVGKSVSPTIFWQLSVLVSVIFLLYGILRKDFAIVLGQCLVYYIYIRNLHLKNFRILLPLLFRWIILIVPILMLGYIFSGYPGNLIEIFSRRFWIISLAGSSMIITYALYSSDPMLFLGQLSGMIVYIRNLMILNKQNNRHSLSGEDVLNHKREI